MNYMNILSLDPMYSCLHKKISDQFSGTKTALLTSYGLSVYLPGFNCFFINKELSKYNVKIPKRIIDIVLLDDNHYTSYVKKVLNCKVDDESVIYMAKFYLYLIDYIKNNSIDLVLLHNDLRWQHSLAVKVCKELGVKYLVTEQGLFRPNTTIVDAVGVNANSNVKCDFIFNYVRDNFKYNGNKDVKYTHDSYKSYYFFFLYLILSKIGRLLNMEAKIVHKKHSLGEYIKRFISSEMFRGKKGNKDRPNKEFIFIPLQLELDTQLLIHSDFNNNQEVIDLITRSFLKLELSSKYDIIFKKHPNDTAEYDFSPDVKVVDNIIDDEFLSVCKLVIGVNSTALLSVLATKIPLITLGRSIYDIDGVCVYSSRNELLDNIDKVFRGDFDISKRKDYIYFLKQTYSIKGAGYSFSDTEIQRILNKLN